MKIMIKIIKIFSCLSVVIVLSACKTSLRADDSDKYLFNRKMVEIFSNDIKTVDSINKSQAQISSIDISKDSKKT